MTESKKILIAEDEVPLMNALKTKLGKAGFSVLGAKNGEQALQMARNENPDILLLDIIMPRLHGIDVYKKIRESDWGMQLPIVLLSNLSNDPHATDIANRDDRCLYLVKSDVKMKEVIEAIQTLLNP